MLNPTIFQPRPKHEIGAILSDTNYTNRYILIYFAPRRNGSRTSAIVRLPLPAHLDPAMDFVADSQRLLGSVILADESRCLKVIIEHVPYCDVTCCRNQQVLRQVRVAAPY